MSEIEDRLRKGARAIYLATESIVADDVSDMMNKAADELATLRAQLAEAVGLLGPWVNDYPFTHTVNTDLRWRAREFIERVGK